MIDTQIISLYLGATDVALYQSVFRIILILLVFSDIVSNVLLPYLSYKYHQKENISELVSKIFLYMLIIGCSLFLAFTSFKISILELLYTPEYVQAAVLVLPFSIVVILRTSSALLGNILTISNRQVYRVLTVGVSLVVSIVLNLICIPKYGILSAAWVSVVVHVVLFGMYYFYSQKEIPSIKLASTYNLIVLAATGLIYAIINHLKDLWNGTFYEVLYYARKTKESYLEIHKTYASQSILWSIVILRIWITVGSLVLALGTLLTITFGQSLSSDSYEKYKQYENPMFIFSNIEKMLQKDERNAINVCNVSLFKESPFSGYGVGDVQDQLNSCYANFAENSSGAPSIEEQKP
ncbi:putative low-salt glycan biosynthesis flippase Agl15 [Nymphon striatum]|nr:putative low-salt glycan biosynthesis flippase Agl15 [Nymphon striatum]